MKQLTAGNYICSRQWNGHTYYAQSVPGDGGVDWGYTTNPAQALPLNKWFAVRFNANAQHCDGKPANVRRVL